VFSALAGRFVPGCAFAALSFGFSRINSSELAAGFGVAVADLAAEILNNAVSANHQARAVLVALTVNRSVCSCAVVTCFAVKCDRITAVAERSILFGEFAVCRAAFAWFTFLPFVAVIAVFGSVVCAVIALFTLIFLKNTVSAAVEACAFCVAVTVNAVEFTLIAVFVCHFNYDTLFNRLDSWSVGIRSFSNGSI
jgi:hypothetical protein